MMLYLDDFDFDQQDSDTEYAKLLQKQFDTDIDQQDPDIEYAKLLQKQFDADSEREEKDRSAIQLEKEKNMSIQEENDRIFAMHEQEKEINNRREFNNNRPINNGHMNHPGFIPNIFLQRNNIGMHVAFPSDSDDSSEEEPITGHLSDYSDRPMQDICDEILEKEPECTKEVILPEDIIGIAFSKLRIVPNVGDVKECCCCLLEIEPEEDTEYTIAVCNHVFHNDCISRRFEEKLECTMCFKYLG